MSQEITPKTPSAPAVDRAALLGVSRSYSVGVEWFEVPDDSTGSSKYGFVWVNGAALSLRVADHANRSSQSHLIETVFAKRIAKKLGVPDVELGRVNIVLPQSQEAGKARRIMQGVLDRLPEVAFRKVIDPDLGWALFARTEISLERKSHPGKSTYVWKAETEVSNPESQLGCDSFDFVIGETEDDFLTWTQESQSTS